MSEKFTSYLAMGELARLKWSTYAHGLMTARGRFLLGMTSTALNIGLDFRPTAIRAEGLARRNGKRPRRPTLPEQMEEMERARDVTFETYRMLLPLADELKAQIAAARRADRPLLTMLFAVHIWTGAAERYAEILEENGRDEEAGYVRLCASEFMEFAESAPSVPVMEN